METIDHLNETVAQQKWDARTKYAFTIFGLLDGVSFLRGIDEIYAYFEWFYFDIVNITRIILVLSFVVSALFFVLRKKNALIIYYIQFPLRALFLILSFGFIHDILGASFDSNVYNTTLIAILGLELVRLIYSIYLHRKLNR